MNKVITINLNGRAYQLEESGYEALRAYLDQAAAKLADNPDKDEIMADFEQAIADKCDEHLTRDKNVVTAAEIEAIIKKMGPVDGGSEGAEGNGHHHGSAGAAGASGTSGAAPKRLFRIPQGEWIMGVCNGLAAYFNLDVTLVRILFVVLGLLTHGIWILAYVILSFVMPPARTEDDVAQAHGETPLSAKDFIDRARAEYAKYAEAGPHSRAEWRQKKDEWKREWHERHHAWKREWREEHRRHREMAHGYGRCSGGFAAVFAGIVIALITLFWVLAIWSFLMTGVVFGFVVGVGHPLWVTLLFLTLIYFLLTWPFRMLAGRGRRCFGGGIFTLLFLILFFYLAGLLFPAVHTWWVSAVNYLQTVR